MPFNIKAGTAFATAITLASVVLSVASFAASPRAAAVKQRKPPPFCIDLGGRYGSGSTPLDCRYYDYQSCLEAAVRPHGNCVRNIDAK
jgi:hypothetical protein